MDIDAEREKIRQEIEELERSLGPSLPCLDIQVSDSSLESGSDDGGDLEDDDSDTRLDMEVDPGGGEGASEEQEDEVDINLPQSPETCLQMNLVYQEVIQEKIVEINLLLAQNKEQQEKLTWELAGTRVSKLGDGKSLPANMFLGHFLKPYFKDKTSGFGPPANGDAREKALQGIKSFEELVTIKWKSREKLLLRQSVMSDRLQRLLQPKLLKLDYLNEKRGKSKDEMGRQILEKQIQETEREINDINLMPEEALLGNRLDEHDWDKIANINFEGTRNATELRKYWQNSEHPSINRKEWSEEEIEKLKEIATRHNCWGWEAIAQELATQRTAFQCLQKFQAYNKDFKRSEWAPEEDHMLLQLVQEMRVGKHIPYRKIAYYMEARDSAQLIYRWSKRVDPNLKRGPWTSEEDAKLLKAVAKYGERDWYKIRAEVPGRNDIQCRDRYLHALNYDIKKGKWSEEEGRKLVELTEKYGVGHWAKIASELPHRSGSQCLSKWKVLLGYGRNRRKKPEKKLLRKRRRVRRASPSLPKSSSEDSDLDLGEGGSTEEDAPKAKAEGRWRVPSIDLWVPTRRSPLEGPPEQLASVTLLSKGFDVDRKRNPGARLDKDKRPVVEGGSGGGGSGGRLLQPAQSKAQEGSTEEGKKNSRGPKDAWRVSLAYVKYVLRKNSYELQRRSREITRKKRFASASQPGPGRSLVPVASEPCRSYGQKDGMWKTTLYRRLMMAVAPWAGSTVQSWALRVTAEASRKSKAEFISKQLQAARLTSTPLFTLFIQLLHIDVGGCMKVIHKRKSRQPELLKAIVGNAGKGPTSCRPGTHKQDAVQQHPPTHVPQQQLVHAGLLPWILKASSVTDPKAQPSLLAAGPHPRKKLIPLRAKEGPVPVSSWTVRCSGPAPKPKTVSQLLKEKRLREETAKAQDSEQRRLVAEPRLLLPSSVITRPQRTPAARGLSRAPNVGQPVHTNTRLSPLPAPSPVAASGPPAPAPGIDAPPLQGAPGGSSDTGAGRTSKGTAPSGGGGHESAPASQKAGPSALLHVSARAAAGRLPSPHPGGAEDAPSCRPASVGPPAAAASSQPGSDGASETILPITWVVTPQGLLPLTVVSVSKQGKPPTGAPAASPNLGQAAAVSSVEVPTVSTVLVADRFSWPPPAAQAHGASSSSPESDGGPWQTALIPPPPPQLPPCPAPPDTVQDPTCPAPSPPREHKVSPDYSLLSREEPAAVKQWAKAGPDGRGPSPGGGLPYLPPFLCSLKTLSALLLNKEALERSAASLVAPGGQQEGPSRPDLTALRTLVHQRLRDNPAYQLLKGRFLAAFTFPAALAALPPFRTTTLSGGRWWERGHGEDSCSSSEEEDSAAERESHGAAGCRPGRLSAVSVEQEEPDVASADSDQFSAPRIRRSTRLRKRKRPL
ncbi:snRNA-activating protein complex subunit 4 [Elgaria multicarinata webbii]|uniref:snRNA-activating protein complex subunit 4 n=1 Tax=Elgaria multicarinata webbii TaxID=159646 RepID=UPI002FCD3DDF